METQQNPQKEKKTPFRPIPRFSPFNSLRHSPFPLGSDPHPPEPDNKFPITFSHLTPLQSPITLDLVAGLKQSLQIQWTQPLDFPILEHPFRSLPNSSPELKESKRKKQNSLRRRQIKAEAEAWASAAVECKELERVLLEKKLAPSLPYVKSLFLGWFEPLRGAIEKEQRVQWERTHKATYAYHIGLLPVAKISVIMMHKMMGFMMRGAGGVC